jgi:hypothetical protein
VAGDGSRVRLDLNSPAFQEVFFRLEAGESRQVVAALGRLLGMEWSSLWGPNGASVHSIRLSQPVRAMGFRDGDFLRLVSLHPDHDMKRFAMGGFEVMVAW